MATPGCPRLVWGEYDAAGVSSVLRDLMGRDSNLEPNGADTDPKRQSQLVVDGLRRFRCLFPETFSVFCTAVPYLILARSDAHTASGGVSSRIGFVWLDPSKAATGNGVGEALFHEYLHQVLFLEDMVRTIFCHDPYALSQSENMVVSAIRGVPRGYARSYHSALVATGLVEYRARLSDISGARALLPALWPCLHALAQKRDLLTDNGAELLDQLIECVRQYDHLLSREPPAHLCRRGEPLDLAPYARPRPAAHPTRLPY